MFMERKMVDELKRLYPVGTRIECDYMNDPFNPISAGTRGTVQHIDDAGQIHIKWDNGSGLALIYGEDSFHKLSQLELDEEESEEI